MPRTYTELMQEIETLKREAEAVREEEVQGVVTRIKEAIAHYGLTPQDLGFGAGAGRTSKKTSRTAASSSARGRQYRDSAGNTWAGRGPRPKWLRDALAQGRSLDEFKV